jgi:hypothetical protein
LLLNGNNVVDVIVFVDVVVTIVDTDFIDAASVLFLRIDGVALIA